MSTRFERTHGKISKLQYMSKDRAEWMRAFIDKIDASAILEVGFFKGKSSAYFASILEDRGNGHLLTIDKKHALKYQPNILQVLKDVGLEHRVTPVFADRSHTWELAQLIKQSPRPQFDLCYFDGGHTWDVTGFGFVLVNMLLKPGGWIVFDDLDWTIEGSLRAAPHRAAAYEGYGEDEMRSPGVRMVYELLVPEFGYQNMDIVDEFGWGVAQKPA